MISTISCKKKCFGEKEFPVCNTHKKHDFDEQRWSQNKIPSMSHHHLSEDHTNSSELLSIILDLERKIFATPPHWELSPLKDKVTWAALTISGLFIPAIETVKLSLNCVNKTTTEKIFGTPSGLA